MTLQSVLTKILTAQIHTIERHVGPITEAEIADRMREARAIHTSNLAWSPDPRDASVPADFHEWAAIGIALNLVARARGYDVASIREHVSATPADEEPVLALAPRVDR